MSCLRRSTALFPKDADYSLQLARTLRAGEAGLVPFLAPAIIPFGPFRRWEGLPACTGSLRGHGVVQTVYNPRCRPVHGLRALFGRRGIIEGTGESASWYKQWHPI